MRSAASFISAADQRASNASFGVSITLLPSSLPHAAPCQIGRMIPYSVRPLFLRACRLLTRPTEKSLPGPNMSQTRNANGLSTPEPSPLQQAPAKRKRPESAVPGPRPTQVGAETPSKKARLAAIEAGLQARHRDETPLRAPQFHSAVSEQDDALPFTRGAEATSAFEADTDTGHDVELPARYSFLNLPPSQESQSGAVPSTPKRHPAPSVRAGQELQDLHSEPSSSTLLTPSPSTQSNGAEPYVNVPGGSGSSRLELGTPTRHKGKGRATPRWDQLAATEVRHSLTCTSNDAH